MKLLQKLRALFRRPELDREMAEEMQAHVDLLAEANRAAGMSPAEAQGAARRQFGHLDGIQEAARDQRRFRWIEDMVQDFGYGWRQLRKAPGFTVTVVLTLAVGIGASVVIFAGANAMLLRPLGYPEAGRLVVLRELRPPGQVDFSVSAGNYAEWQKQASVFESLAAAYSAAYNLSGAGEPARVDAQRVTANYFGTLQVQPFLGRDFRPEDDEPGHENVVILSHGYWLRQFAGRADVLNQSIRLNGQPFTVIGVMPADFRQFQNYQVQIWTPAAFSGAARENRGNRFINEIVGRLKPGVALAQARSEMALIAGRLGRQFPDTNEGWGAQVVFLHDYSVQYLRAPTLGLFGAVMFLLLIGCANVANLLLARGTTRQRELAIRAAMGASRGRVVRQLLVESLLLAACGGGLGLLLAFWGVQAAFGASDLVHNGSIAIDGRVAGFACALTVATSLVFGLVPAWRISRTSPIDAIKGQAGVGPIGQSRRLLGFLVVAEIALALVLLAGAGLMMREFTRVLRAGPGFALQDAFVLELSLAGENYAAAPQKNAFIDEMLARMAGLPGVTAVGVTDVLPLSGNGSVPGFSIPGRPPASAKDRPSALAYRVSPDYFQAMGIGVRQGRLPTAPEGSGTTVAVINDVLARRFFPGEDPVGRRIELDGAEREIVGVVGRVQHYSPGEVPQSQIYLAMAPKPSSRLYFVVRADATAGNLSASLRAIVQSVDRNQPIARLGRLEDYLAQRISGPRLVLVFFATFSVAALLLAGIGIYGVMAYSVAQRTGEIGLRMALGAERGAVLRLVAAQGGRLVGLGLVVGLAGTFALLRLIQSVLQSLFAGARTDDPLVFAGVAALLGLVGFAACLLPARRATRIDPVVALRAE